MMNQSPIQFFNNLLSNNNFYKSIISDTKQTVQVMIFYNPSNLQSPHSKTKLLVITSIRHQHIRLAIIISISHRHT